MSAGASSRPADGLVALLAPTSEERRRGARAVGLGLGGQLAGLGLLASAAWLITTASLRPPVLTLTVAIAAVQAFALSRGIARYGERLAGHDLALRVLARVRTWAYRHLEELVPGPTIGTRSGDLLARFVSDVDGILDLYVRAALPVLTAAATSIVAVTVAWLLDPPAGVVIGAGLLIAMGVLPLATAWMAAPAASRLATTRGERDALVAETLRGATEIVAFGAEAATVRRVAGTDRSLNQLARRVALATGAGQALSVGLAGVLAAAVLAVAVPGLKSGSVGGPTVAVLVFLALGVADAVSGLPEAFAHRADALSGARRVLALATTAPSVTAPDRPLPDPPCRVSPTFALEAVSVIWPGRRRPALEGIDLCIDPGAHIAVIGPSGAGKTTLSHLLLRFINPTAGRVTLNGTDIGDFDPDAVRRLIAWAPQDPHIFGTTLAANVRLARPDATDAAIRACLDLVGLGDWVDALPDGLSTVLGERGTTVSGGEAQRIGLVRALIADRPILLLDEPTAHLDEGAAAAIQRQVLRAAQGRTLIWITHRVSELDDFDAVISLADGRAARLDFCPVP